MTKRINKRTLKIIMAIIIIAIISILIFIFGCFIAYHENRLCYEVNSIVAYQYEDNPDYYRIEIDGTVKTYFFDNREFDSVSILGPSMGGEPEYSNAYAESEPINITKEKANFKLKYDIDLSSRNGEIATDESRRKMLIENAFYGDCFITTIDDEGYEYKYALYGSAFCNIPFEWKENQVVTDSLLDE